MNKQRANDEKNKTRAAIISYSEFINHATVKDMITDIAEPIID